MSNGWYHSYWSCPDSVEEENTPDVHRQNKKEFKLRHVSQLLKGTVKEKHLWVTTSRLHSQSSNFISSELLLVYYALLHSDMERVSILS